MKVFFHTTCRKLILPALLCSLFTFSAYSQLTPITLTSSSFNYDLIAESGNNPQTVTTAALDGSGNNILYSANFKSVNSSTITSGGLPNSGTLTNSGNSWQLASYSSNNALLFKPQSSVSSGTLTLATPAQFAQISLLDAAGYGPTSVSITLKFTDGSSRGYGSFSILDWFDQTPYVVDSLGRISRNSTVSNNNAPVSDPRLYQTVISLNTTDQSKNLSSILIYDNSTNNNSTAAFFAVSGAAPGTLALNSITLNGQYNAANQVVSLDWNIITDANGSDGEKYEIQRSSDGYNFTGIAQIDAAATGTDNYFWQDNSIQQGQSYVYRILGTAPTGQEIYSNSIRIIASQAQSKFSAYQSASTLYVNTGTSSQPVQFAVYSISGQEYRKGTSSGTDRFTVDLYGLASGIYLIRLQNGNGSETIEFMH